MTDKEYITKDDALQAIYSFPYVMRNSEVLDRIANSIRFTPSKDVAPVVHGKWVEPSYGKKKAGICGSTDAMAGKCRCSVCRHEEPVFEEYPKYNYCPHCGAKMDESEDEE